MELKVSYKAQDEELRSRTVEVTPGIQIRDVVYRANNPPNRRGGMHIKPNPRDLDMLMTSSIRRPEVRRVVFDGRVSKGDILLTIFQRPPDPSNGWRVFIGPDNEYL